MVVKVIYRLALSHGVVDFWLLHPSMKKLCLSSDEEATLAVPCPMFSVVSSESYSYRMKKLFPFSVLQEDLPAVP